MTIEEMMQPEFEDKEQWAISNDNEANWVFEVMADADADLERAKLQYKYYMEKAQEFLQKAQEKRDSTVAWGTKCLEEYAGEQLAGSKKKSLKFIGGSVSYKKQQPEWKRDDESLLQWAEQNATDYIKVRKSVDWAGLKKTLKVQDGKAVTEDGEIVPSVEIIERPEKFEVKVG